MEDPYWKVELKGPKPAKRFWELSMEDPTEGWDVGNCVFGDFSPPEL